jgi:hypothetical protein
VEVHVDEPRGDNEQDTSEVWNDVTAGFVDLGARLRNFFESAPDEEANEEMKGAWSDFTSAAQRLGRSVTEAIRDEDVQKGVKSAFRNLVDAVGTTVRDAGGKFTWSPDESNPDESDPASTDNGEGADEPTAGAEPPSTDDA